MHLDIATPSTDDVNHSFMKTHLVTRSSEGATVRAVAAKTILDPMGDLNVVHQLQGSHVERGVMENEVTIFDLNGRDLALEAVGASDEAWILLTGIGRTHLRRIQEVDVASQRLLLEPGPDEIPVQTILHWQVFFAAPLTLVPNTDLVELNSDTYGSPSILMGMSRLLVDNPDVDGDPGTVDPYRLEVVRSQIEAFLSPSVVATSGSSVRDIYYNDPRTWDIVGVKFATRQAGSFQVNVIPPPSSAAIPFVANDTLLLNGQQLHHRETDAIGNPIQTGTLHSELAWANFGANPGDRPGEGIIVAVIDSGVELDHPDLKNNIWTNHGEVAGDGLDNDGNGFVDDVHGWDFVSGLPDPGPSHPHGTLVAGVIAAESGNALGVAGVAGHATILPLKVNQSGPLGAALGGPKIEHLVDAIDYAIANHANIINLSVVPSIDGTDASDYTAYSRFVAALNRAYDAGVLITYAAGNDGAFDPFDHFLNQVLVVANTDQMDNRHHTSSYGPGVDVSAPGTEIWTTTTSFGYESVTGTSFSAPNAAGVAALIWSHYHDLWEWQSLTPRQQRDRVAALLTGTADGIADDNGGLGSGRVNASRALTESLPSPRILPPGFVTAAGGKVIGFEFTFDQKLDPETVNQTESDGSLKNFQLFELRDDRSPDLENPVALFLRNGEPYRIGSNSLQVVTQTANLKSGTNYVIRVNTDAVTNPFGSQLRPSVGTFLDWSVQVPVAIGRTGDVIALDLSQLVPEGDFVFDWPPAFGGGITTENVTAGLLLTRDETRLGIVVDPGIIEGNMSSTGRFNETGRLYFLPEIDTQSPGSGFEGEIEGSFTAASLSTGATGPIEFRFTVKPGYSETGVNSVSLSQGRADVWRVEQRLRYLGIPNLDGEPASTNGVLRFSDEYATSLFRALVTQRSFATSNYVLDDVLVQALNTAIAPSWVELVAAPGFSISIPTADECTAVGAAFPCDNPQRWTSSWTQELLEWARRSYLEFEGANVAKPNASVSKLQTGRRPKPDCTWKGRYWLAARFSSWIFRRA